MDSIISIQDIRTTLGTIAQRAQQGESFIVIKNSKPAFRIVPIEKMSYGQKEAKPALTLKEIRARFKANPLKKDELTPQELDVIIHDIHRNGPAQ